MPRNLFYNISLTDDSNTSWSLKLIYLPEYTRKLKAVYPHKKKKLHTTTMEEKYYEDHQISFPIIHFVILYFNMTVEYVHISPENLQQVTTIQQNTSFQNKPLPHKASTSTVPVKHPSFSITCTIFSPCIRRLYFIVKAGNWCVFWGVCVE